jgi:hypothetical protein
MSDGWATFGIGVACLLVAVVIVVLIWWIVSRSSSSPSSLSSSSSSFSSASGVDKNGNNLPNPPLEPHCVTAIGWLDFNNPTTSGTIVWNTNGSPASPSFPIPFHYQFHYAGPLQQAQGVIAEGDITASSPQEQQIPLGYLQGVLPVGVPLLFTVGSAPYCSRTTTWLFQLAA